MEKRHRWYRLEPATSEVLPPGKYVVRDESEPRVTTELELFAPVPVCQLFRRAPRRVPTLAEFARRLSDE